jgi:hypothetical protein
MSSTRTAGVLISIALQLAGCTRSGSLTPSAPSPPAPPVAMTRQPPAYIAPIYHADFVLSGVVYEITATGLSPLQGATIYCDACGEYGHTWQDTNDSGVYSFSGLWTTGGTIVLSVMKQGYVDPPGQPALSGYSGAGWRAVTLARDGRFDMQLGRKAS